MNNILEIWENIEQSNEIGLLKRLYTNDSELFIYAIFKIQKDIVELLYHSMNIHILIFPLSLICVIYKLS